MSERVSNELAQAIANGRGFATPSDWPLVDVEVMVALDLLDSRARVKELEHRIRRALNELGIPQPEYPAPVANAVSILRGEE
jgi:hypothetical protein